MMKPVAIAFLFTVVTSVMAFLPSSVPHTSLTRLNARTEAYVPDGLTEQQWREIKAKDKAKANNLGKIGVTKFKSRSLQGWQEAGANHLFPADPKTTKEEKKPYMMRKQGKWDDSDVGDKKEWSKTDIKYENGGERAQQNAGFWGGGAGLASEILPWR